MGNPKQDDLTHEGDEMVAQTANGQKSVDPDNSDVSQDPDFIPEGSETEK
jgi:hypothetical protein